MTVPIKVARKVGGRLEWADNALPTFAWPGAYPIWYIAADGTVYCATCADKRGVRIIDAEIAWEGPAEVCADCGRDLDTAYGDPDNPDEEVTS